MLVRVTVNHSLRCCRSRAVSPAVCAPQAVPLLRSLDALHLAVALDIREREGLDFFVCADKDLCTVAEAEQLRVLNPTA
jgi:hypothetical protein